jgi:hypothetical protein
MLAAARLWRRTSARGVDYLAGRLGGLKIIVMPRRDSEPGDHSHTLMFAEAPQRQEGGR